MQGLLRASLLASVFLPAAASAQRVWIVDNVSPAGAHFNDLPDALASPMVGHGDVLVLRAANGTYLGATTGKGVTICAPGTATIRPSLHSAPGTTLSVANLPQGTRFSLRNVRIEGLPDARPLVLGSCAGSVHLDAVTIVAPVLPLPVYNGAGLTCTACSAVTVQGSRIEGKPAILATTSSLAVTSSTILGSNAQISDLAGFPAGDGIRTQACDVTIAFSTVAGGNGASITIPFSIVEICHPALVLSGGSLLVGGRAGDTQLLAGVPSGNESMPAVSAPAIASGAAVLDPRVQLTPRGGAQPFVGPHTLRTVAALGVARPSTFAVNATVARLQGDAAVLIGGLTAPPVNSPLGSIWLDLGLSLSLARGVIGAGDGLLLQVTAPNLSVLFGLPFGLQAAVLSAAGLEVTNPSVIVLGT